MLPSSLSEEDVGILLNEVLRAMNVQSSARLLSTSVVSEKFISGCLALFDDIMQQKAQKVCELVLLLHTTHLTIHDRVRNELFHCGKKLFSFVRAIFIIGYLIEYLLCLCKILTSEY